MSGQKSLKKPLHQRKRSKKSISDEWWTPKDLFHDLCLTYNIHPRLDVACTTKNRICELGLEHDLGINALDLDWVWWNSAGVRTEVDVWCNPPNSDMMRFVMKANEQHFKWNINIMMIIPANAMCTKYAKQYIEGSAEYHPIFTRPQFLYEGKPSEFTSRNGYFVVIWRKK